MWIFEVFGMLLMIIWLLFKSIINVIIFAINIVLLTVTFGKISIPMI